MLQSPAAHRPIDDGQQRIDPGRFELQIEAISHCMDLHNRAYAFNTTRILVDETHEVAESRPRCASVWSVGRLDERVSSTAGGANSIPPTVCVGTMPHAQWLVGDSDTR